MSRSIEIDLERNEMFPPEAGPGAVSNEIDAPASFASNLDIDDSAGDLHAPDPTRDLGSKTTLPLRSFVMVYHKIEPTPVGQRTRARQGLRVFLLLRDRTQVVNAPTNDGWSWQIDDVLATRGEIITIVDVANIRNTARRPTTNETLLPTFAMSIT